MENAIFALVPYLDAMNRRHVVVELPSNVMLDFGYIYIHEEWISESQGKARTHHHWHFIKEGCDMLKEKMVMMGDGGEVSSLELSSKTRKLVIGSSSCGF